VSEEDLTNYKTYISDLDITKYIVLDNESNYWYSAEYVDKMLKKQDKEIERLNKELEFEKLKNKEVREYVEEWQRFPHTNGSTHKELKNLIDILDKE